MRRIHQLLAIFLVACAAIACSAQQGESSKRAVADAMKAGHWAEALQLSRLRLEAGDGTPKDLESAVQSLSRLNRIEEFDTLVEKTAERYADDPAMLLAAAKSYQRVPRYGYVIAGEFRRGQQRGGGTTVSVEERDRVRALRLGVAALGLADDDALFQRIGYTLAEELMRSRQGRASWRLQLLTDLDAELPEPAEGRWNSVAQSDPPVAPGGEMPLLYEVPASWDAATSDGERWRWVLAEIARRIPVTAHQADLRYANFLRGQFGVQSLARSGWFHQPNDEAPSDETSALAVETLSDEETIAKLATGVRRFTLPKGHRYIELFRKRKDWATLSDIYLNRNQRPQAVEATRKWLAATTNEGQRRSIQQNLDQLTKPWGRLEGTMPQPAGEGAELRITHRNAARVELIAKRIDVEQLLADARATLQKDRREVEGMLLKLDQLGWRLIEENQSKYLTEQVAAWSVDLENAPQHRDAESVITTPLQGAGAYQVTVKPIGTDGEAGAESKVVVWIADTVIIRKVAADGVLHQVVDARTGEPIVGATVDLFGWGGKRTRGPNGKRGEMRVVTERYVEITDSDGVCWIDATPETSGGGYQWLTTATTPQGRLAYLGFYGLWRAQRDDNPPQQARTFVVTDRPVYRPEDTVEFKLWIGKPNYLAAATPEGDAEPAPSPFAHQEFQVDLYDARGEKISSQRLTADAYGGLVGSHELPASAALGVYRIDLVGFGGGSFRVEEYRKPEFEVTVEAPSEPTKLGEPFEAKINATYYAGTPVRGGSLKYQVTRTKKTEHWLPPRPWDWLYGRGYGWLGQQATWRRDWRAWGCFGPWPAWNNEPPEVVAEGEATLDADGVYKLSIETKTAAARHPNDDHEYKITAEVTDAGRRTINGTGRVLAARRPVDVTVWLDRGFYDVGDTVQANVSARRPDGEPMAGGGDLRLMKIGAPVDAQPVGEGGQPVELVDPPETLVQAWSLSTKADGAAEMRLKASEPGRYRLVYKCQAAKQPVEGGMIFTVRGPGFDGGGFRFGDLELVPDKPEYAPGETLRLQVNTDRADSTVTLYIRPVGGIYAKPTVLRLAGKSTVVEVPVGRGDMPNFFVEAHTVSDGELHTVQREIVVPPESRVINVEASPSATTYLPGEEGSLRVRLTDSEGQPVVGQATIAVYDRSVEAIAGGPSGGDIRERFWDWKRSHSASTHHSLMRYERPTHEKGVPTMQSLGVFGHLVPRRGRGLSQGYGRGGQIFLGRELMESGMSLAKDAGSFSAAAPMSRMAMSESADASGATPESSVAVRENFADTAVWVGAVETDAEGFANVTMPLPDSLTAWKVRVWAISPGLRVGQGESEVVTRKDLMVRLRTPRFLVDGDTATFAALVQNESPRELTVKVRLEADGDVLGVPSIGSMQVVIPAGGEELVDWRITAKAEGDATVRAIAEVVGDPKLSDAMQIELPVLVHGAERVESFSAVIAPDERLTTFELVVPEERRPEATRLEVRYSPTLVGAMLDTLPYLIEYPHGCTEQTLNRFLPAAIVRQTIQDLGVELADLKPEEDPAGPPRRSDPVFDRAELDKIVKAGVRRLMEMQLSDGGWGWFRGFGERSSAHTTAVVVRGLGVAKKSGVAVPDDVLKRGLDWLTNHQAEQLKRLANGDERGDRIDDNRPWKRHADNLDALVELAMVEAGDRRNQDMTGRLYKDRLRLSPYALAMLGINLQIGSQQAVIEGLDYPAMRDTVVRNLKQYVQTDDENQTAYLNLPGGYWWTWYGSEFEAHAYFLKLLAATEPKGDLAPKLVKYLLANRRHATRWNSTRDTALVVEAMADYVRASGEAATDGSVEVWLNGKLRDTQEFDAASALRFDGRFVLEGAELPAGRHTLELRRQGAGRLYAGASLTNFTLEDDIRAAGLEVRVKRRVQKLVPIEGTADNVDARGGLLSQKVEKYRRIGVPNLGAVESGDLIEVELTIASKNDYEYLLIEDPKPAGFEPVEVRSGYNGNAMGAYVEFRDERVLFYARTLARGERTVRYRLKAETPGKFSALPTQIRAMYAPELRGNSDEIKVVVEEAEK